ncbi:MAG: sigma-E processing peptidase SpoIIGA [Ruminococcaceae bacterium]|nr:sigma-E processing peptidase SpoIIGA [Oscillospiraceae bacterium]
MKPVIYADVLFAVNLLINYILLRTTAALARIPSSPPRTLCGALAGAVYAVLIFFPQIRMFYTMIAKFAFSLVMVAVAFRIRRVRVFARVLGIFYFVSFTFGGVTLALLCYTGIGMRFGSVVSNGIFYFDLPWTTLAVSTLIAYVVIRTVWRFYRNGRGRDFKQVEICTLGNRVRLHALVDTGNMLTDPLTGTPVMIAELDAVQSLLPIELCELCREEPPEQALSMTEDAEWAGRLRIIPFSAVGNDNGMLLGFRPDRITVDNCPCNQMLVGITDAPLSPRREYEALLNPDAICCDTD